MSFDLERTPATTTVNLFGGHRFEIPSISDQDLNSWPITLLHGAGTLVGEAFAKLKVITGDRTLSPLGIEQKADPVKAEALGRIAAAAMQLQNFDDSISARETSLYAVPTLDPTAAAVAIEDREIRDWWRSMETKQRNSTLQSIEANPEQHERLMIALLRAPAPLAILDHETKFVMNAWKDAKRANSPELAAQIDIDRALVETARRGLSHLAGISKQATGWQADKVLKTIVSSQFEPARTGYQIFGFNETQAVRARALNEFESRKN